MRVLVVKEDFQKRQYRAELGEIKQGDHRRAPMERPKRYRCGQANRTSRTKFFMIDRRPRKCLNEHPCRVGT